MQVKKKFLILAPLLKNKETTSEQNKQHIGKTLEAVSNPSKVDISHEAPEKVVPKANKPLGTKSIVSEFSITGYLNKVEEKLPDLFAGQAEEDLPDHHFTETDLQSEWQLFLEELQEKDNVTYNAINAFKLSKKDENVVEILYPSDSAKSEFDKIQADFFNHFKRKVNNFKIEIVFRNDIGLKKEILTKRKIFDKFVEINPVLKDLEDLMKFDFS